MIPLVTFLAGFSIMVLEIVAARVLAPYLGTSLTVWTAVIGVMMVSLSAGYWMGGRLADRAASPHKLAAILHGAVGWVLLSIILQVTLLSFLSTAGGPLALVAICLTTVLFGPSGALLAIVSPYVARLQLQQLGTAGATVGRLSAIATAGSLLGTFLAGFVLLEQLGSTTVQLVIAGIIFVAAVVLSPRSAVLTRIGLVILALVVVLVHAAGTIQAAALGTLDVDTRYSKVRVQYGVDAETGRTVKQLILGNVLHSAQFTDSEEHPEREQLVYPYTRAYRLAASLRQKPERVLMLGGAAYTVPRDIRHREPQASVDVVEIDPGMLRLAREQFGLKDDLLITSYLMDGRRFVNQAQTEGGALYDWIFGDAFSSFYSIPFELTTKQAYQAQYNLLQPGGIYMGNIISAVSGPASGFLQAEVATIQAVFGNDNRVLILPINPERPEEVQNVMLVAVKDASLPETIQSNDQFLQSLWSTRRTPAQIAQNEPVLTDDFAPTERYLQAMLDQRGR